MKLITDIHEFPELKNPVVTIGNFDGVHKGHRAVIERIHEIARQEGGETVIITLWPHPRLLLNRNLEHLRFINTIDEKIELLRQTHVDYLLILRFDVELSNMAYEDFIQKILVDKVHLKHLVIGHDHTFGKNREGNFENLSQSASHYGFKVYQLESVVSNDIEINSSKIRKALRDGDVNTGNNLLGYPFFISGHVIEGNRIGRTIGFPTANIMVNEPYKLIPADGVYAVQVMVEKKMYHAMLNIGFRPTIHSNVAKRSIEANIFDFDQNIYGEELNVFFYKKMRDEKKFESLDLLVQQIRKDKEDVLNYFNQISA